MCNTSLEPLAAVPQITTPNLNKALTVTNAVASSQGLIFSASGEAGVFAYQAKHTSGSIGQSNCTTITPTLLGMIDFGDEISANNLAFAKGILFVSTGLGGFKIIGIDKAKSSDDYDDFD